MYQRAGRVVVVFMFYPPLLVCSGIIPRLLHFPDCEVVQLVNLPIVVFYAESFTLWHYYKNMLPILKSSELTEKANKLRQSQV